MPQGTRHKSSNINIFQENVATHFECSGMFKGHIIINFLFNMAVKSFGKLVNNYKIITTVCCLTV